MRKNGSPITVELVMEILGSLDGRGHLDEIDGKLCERGQALISWIKARYPTDQQRRDRLQCVLSQTGFFERIGGPRSATYQISQGSPSWKRA